MRSKVVGLLFVNCRQSSQFKLEIFSSNEPIHTWDWRQAAKENIIAFQAEHFVNWFIICLFLQRTPNNGNTVTCFDSIRKVQFYLLFIEAKCSQLSRVSGIQFNFFPLFLTTSGSNSNSNERTRNKWWATRVTNNFFFFISVCRFLYFTFIQRINRAQRHWKCRRRRKKTRRCERKTWIFTENKKTQIS